ncbi:MAG: type III pantothenate kinase [Ferruginibacter sp.]|nr:type III pantothenate kinase [Ferruginibacter sp.]NOU38849.1 type III pantothenate kinase [Ferruginibacter sp.]
MITTLCFDFGNTRLKAAIFKNEELYETVYLENDDEETIETILKKYTPQNTILSSVINHNQAIENLLAQKSNFHKLSASTKINFTTPVGKPETIGADRLALCAAAAHFFSNKNNLIIGLGSCITYNFLNQQRQFLGGGISPGMNMRFKSMHDYTALLPLEAETWNFPLIGYDTRTNLQSGVLNGMAAEIDGIIDRYANKFNNFNVVLTGGNTSYFAGQLKNRIFADHNFLFKGLYALSQINNSHI